MIKDLGSSNGTFVNGRRIESCILTAEDVAVIGPVSLLLGDRLGSQAVPAASPQQPKIIVEDFGTEVFYDRPRIDECTTLPYPQRLEDVRRRLSELTDPTAVYPEVCRALAQDAKTAAAIFRVPPGDEPMSMTPQVAAYHFGTSGEDTLTQARSREPSRQGLRVSHRLLEAVRANARPLMTKSIFSCDTQVTISLIDELSPRALLCSPIGPWKQTVDLLSVGVPIDDRAGDGPEEMFALVQAVAAHATSVIATTTPTNDG
jgi:hypothetical protein